MAALVDGHSSALLQVDSIVADGRLEVCDGSYIAFVMKTGRGKILGVASKGCDTLNGPAQAELGRGTLRAFK